MLHARRGRSPLKALSIAIMLIVLIMLLAFDVLLLHRQSTPGQAASVVSNPIVQENLLPGTISWQMTKESRFDLKTLRSPAIEGYASATSAIAGDTLAFSVSTSAQFYQVNIYRLGWYQGLGGRLLQTISDLPGHFYPMPASDSKTGLLDANWPVSFTIKIQPGWVTGIFVAKLISADGTEAYVPFVVRSVEPTTFVFLHGDLTDQAYNPWGGKSLYDYNSTGEHRAYKVSLDRPLVDQAGFGNLLYWEYPMIRWLEKNGYDIGYLSEVDLQTNANALKNHKGILIVGHSEYWSMQMLNRLEAAVDSGTNLGDFAADTASWQIRFEPSLNTPHIPNRVIVCYKDKSLDPLYTKDNTHVTVAFKDPLINKPPQAFFGSMDGAYFTNSSGFPWVISNNSSWIFAGTNLQNSDSLPGLVGYECDVIDPRYPIPAGLSILSASPVTNDNGHPGVCDATLYTNRNGARVFNAATFRWSWGLDSFNMADGHVNVENTSAQEITQNILQNFQEGSD